VLTIHYLYFINYALVGSGFGLGNGCGLGLGIGIGLGLIIGSGATGVDVFPAPRLSVLLEAVVGVNSFRILGNLFAINCCHSVTAPIVEIPSPVLNLG
jgi:hypothetical protein